MHKGRMAASAVAAALVAGGTLAALPAVAVEVEAAPTVVINEVDSQGDPEDWMELYNYGTETVDLSGMYLRDDKEDDADHLQFAEGTTLAAGEYLLLDATDFLFGIGKTDTVRLFAEDDSTLIDSYTLPAHPTTSWGRCPDGTGDFVETETETPGTANDCPEPATVEEYLKVNEVESKGDDSVLGGADWIELINTSDEALDLNDVIVIDGKIEDAETDAYTISGMDPVAAGGFVVLTDEQFAFGLGKGDSAQLYSAGTSLADIATGVATPFETYTWGDSHADQTYGRCPDGTGDFVDTAAPTPGAANDCSDSTPVTPETEPDDYSSTLAINEVESNGDDTDWVEVMNLTDEAIDISGWAIKDNDDSRTDVVPAGSVVPANGLLIIDQESATYPEGFTFGLGNGDEFRLYDLSGELVAKATWAGHATVSWGRCPDGTGDWADTTASTKGEPNDCSLPIRINEVESKDAADGPDWVELTNIGSETVDLTGLVLSDDDTVDHRYTIPSGSLAPGAFLVIDADSFGFGLGGGDAVNLFASDGTTLVDSYEWSSHAATTYGRCPDGTGDFETTASATPGAANECEGIVTASAWPGGTDVSTIDAEDDYPGDMSGIDYAASGTDAAGTLWAVQNGDGLLYHLAVDGSVLGGWTLRYPDGTGTVDAEGVTVTDESGAVYVSSERNNDASSTSRPSVLRYDVSDAGAELAATDEWNLASLLPALSANGGLEGVTWIPDAWLTEQGFVDESTGIAYDPADYTGHGNGLFVVGVESTASAYVVALMDDGSVALLATISTESVSFSLVADVQFSGAGALWVVCDEACGGRIALYTLQDGAFVSTALYERPSGMANIANEGFAIGDSTVCVDGSVPTYYADDADTDGFSLRTGTLPCVGNVGTALDSATTGGSGDGEGSGELGGGSGITAPSSAKAGATITIGVGSAYDGEKVTVELHSTPVVLGTPTATSGEVSVTIPADTEAGTHTLYVYDSEGELIGTAALTITPAATSATGSGELAATGADTSALAWGALLVFAGIVLQLGRRQLRREG